MILKLDFLKAYDCVRWDFFEMVLLKIGLGTMWTSWMLEFVSTAKATVLVNGLATNEFRICRGLKQGDLLSPFLFILVTKFMLLMLDKVEELRLIGGVNDVIPGKSFTHLQFVDETILFLRADEEVVMNTKYILCCFEIFLDLVLTFTSHVLWGLVFMRCLCTKWLIFVNSR